MPNEVQATGDDETVEIFRIFGLFGVSCESCDRSKRHLSCQRIQFFKSPVMQWWKMHKTPSSCYVSKVHLHLSISRAGRLVSDDVESRCLSLSAALNFCRSDPVLTRTLSLAPSAAIISFLFTFFKIYLARHSARTDCVSPARPRRGTDVA